jgi:hypothetical protein
LQSFLPVAALQHFLSDPIQNAFLQGFFHEETQRVPFLRRQPDPMRNNTLF